MTETELYHEIHLELAAICKVNNVTFHYVRIESPIQAGVPDINVCIKGKEFWIECKVDDYILTPLQIAWAVKREDSSGKVYSLFYMQDTYSLYNSVLFMRQSKSLSEIIDYIIIDVLGKDWKERHG